MAVGEVRLDNRRQVMSWLHDHRSLNGGTDMQVVAAAVCTRGIRCIPDLLGDFAFVVWDKAQRELVAARDALGVRTLYYREINDDLIGLSSRATALVETEIYDSEYVADYFAEGLTQRDRSVFDQVRTVAPGTIVSLCPQRTVLRYWSADAFEIDESLAETPAQQRERFRELFTESVRLRLTGRSDCWAQLSGGLDSSSIVATAQKLQQTGCCSPALGGTVTIVDTSAGSNEKLYAEEVVRSLDVRNETVVDYYMWQEDGRSPPLTEAPNPQYPFFARDRKMGEVVWRGGGRVLLSGLGSDHYLWGNLLFFADRLARGQWRSAARDLVRWSALGRRSLWGFAYENALMPLMPPSLQRLFDPAKFELPFWISKTFSRRMDLRTRALQVHATRGSPGHLYERRIARAVDTIGFGYDSMSFTHTFDMRYPFLFRPLVEFSLRLPVQMRTRPHARKWVLRQAMRDTLPQRIVRRRGKSGISTRMYWSLVHQRPVISELLRDPLVAQHGWVDASLLAEAFRQTINGKPHLHGALIRTLALETWLRVRSGRWVARQ